MSSAQSARTVASDAGPVTSYDIVVLGAGSAGERAAIKLARSDRTVAVIEAGRVGGICPFIACIPSKALLRPAHLLAEAAAVPGLTPPGIDPAPLLSWRDDLVRHLDDTWRADRLDDEHVTLVRGTGRLDGPGRVRVGDLVLEARQAVIVATGAEAVMPPIDGIDTVPVLTSDDLTVVEAVPDELLLIGGGIIGCELAQAFAALGTRVTLLHEGERLLDRHEPTVGKLVLAAMQDLGVDVHLGAEVTHLQQRDGDVLVTTSTGTTHVTAQLAIVTGRRPRLYDIGLETIGLDPDSIDTSQGFEVTPQVYVIGDAADGRYTHMANAHADVAVAAIRGEGVRTAVPEPLADDRAPSVTFTTPAVATVGRRSSDVGSSSVVVEADLGDTAAAVTMGIGVAGAVIAVFSERRVLEGMTIVGPGAADMLHAATIAVANQLDIDQLSYAIPAFPTLSGIWDTVLARARRRFD